MLHIKPPANTKAAARDVLSQVLVRLGDRFGMQGMQDWSVQLRGTNVLGTASEFHDLSKMRAENQDFVLYFSEKRRAREFGRLIACSFPELRVSQPKPAPKVDWVKKWKKYYKPVRIQANRHTPELWILPSWIKRKVPLKIQIDPGQAFGTGTHATTQLCLELFLGIKSKTQRVLDFGAGTGILAMAAAKRDSARVHCIEIDSTARQQLKKNLKLNHVKAKITTKPQGQYDLIFANVLAPVLLANKRLLLKALKPGGTLILSGILHKEAHSFLNDFLPPKRRQLALKAKGDWAAVLIESLKHKSRG